MDTATGIYPNGHRYGNIPSTAALTNCASIYLMAEKMGMDGGTEARTLDPKWQTALPFGQAYFQVVILKIRF